ncbi:MAG TPA: hypothetical protein VHE54_15430 [Puia sp.]|nr:hypothetical protein [Puia sp.]
MTVWTIGMRMKPGPYYLLLLLAAVAGFAGLSSCRKTDSAARGMGSDTLITDTTIFIDITLAGNRTLGIYDPAQHPAHWGNTWGQIDPDTSWFAYDRMGATFTRGAADAFPQFSFSLGNLNTITSVAPGQHLLVLPVSVADSFFAPRDVAFARPVKDTSFSEIGGGTIVFAGTRTRTLLSPGVNLSWIDTAGTRWETLYGAADQAGSYFTITGCRLHRAAIPGYANLATVTANFACTLYDGKGHTMRLTGGRLRQTLFL